MTFYNLGIQSSVLFSDFRNNFHMLIFLYMKLSAYCILLDWFMMIYLLTAIGLTPSGSNTVHIYTQIIHRTTQWNRIHRTEHT